MFDLISLKNDGSRLSAASEHEKNLHKNYGTYSWNKDAIKHK